MSEAIFVEGLTKTYAGKTVVDHADFIIAVWDGRPGGTGKTATYARGRNGKSIIVIDPVTLAVERLKNTQKSGVSIKAGGNHESPFASEKSICYPAIIWMMHRPHCSA